MSALSDFPQGKPLFLLMHNILIFLFILVRERERTRNHLISTMAPGFRRFAALRCVTKPDRYITNDLGMKYRSESY